LSKYKYTISTDKVPTKFMVYLATSPSGKQYVGITSRALSVRIAEHVHNSVVNDYFSKLSKAINKYNINNIEFTIIDYAKNREELKELEVYYISKLNSYKKGYNSTLGGDGASLELTKQQRIVQSINKGGKEFSVYTLKGEFVGRWISTGLCAEDLNLRSKGLRLRCSEISSCLNMKNKYVIDNYIFVYTDKDEQIKLTKIQNKIRTPKATEKQFNVYSLKTYELIGQFNNQSECARILGVIGSSQISNCLNGKNKSCYDYYFIYAENDNQEIPEQLKYRLFNVYDEKTGELVTQYEKQADCVKDLKLDKGALSGCLRNKVRSQKGYIFIYSDQVTNKKLQELNIMPFEVYSVEGLYIGTWVSKNKCFKELKLHTSGGIYKCLKNQAKTCGGYKFSYIENEEKPLIVA